MLCPGDKSRTGVYPGRMTIVRSRPRQAANRSEYQNMRLHRNRRITLKRAVAHRNSSCIALDRFSRKPLRYHSHSVYDRRPTLSGALRVLSKKDRSISKSRNGWSQFPSRCQNIGDFPVDR